MTCGLDMLTKNEHVCMFEHIYSSMFEHIGHQGIPSIPAFFLEGRIMSSARHTDLAQEIAQGIASGRFPVGSLLPTEFELCEQYDATRYTVRMALGELQEQGLISRKKNV